ncbi:recombinase family protein [Lyngbya sp. CCY1209]|jgi:DNA invertase Pin-like site-specific DNA recombinase|uniref:recombinase family protein n=1 Tax=Lyngbya sp. CCY1209 TaxID=2886103 RepID=UPI002D2147C0|nr:recombinase family protein [Lyngbya sp. CCY1209]MEB3886085.1 recombinase family protein [Lyngbya sp. CCY1209]
MRIIAYSYTDPLLETAPDRRIWGWEVDRIYLDLGGRSELEKLLEDCRSTPAEYLLIRRYEELGESVREVGDRLDQFDRLKIQVIAIESDGKASETSRVELIRFLAEIQRGQHSRRIRKGHAKNRLKALPPPGKAPYGYRRGKERYAIDRAAAPIVKEFFERFLIYGSLRGAVRYLEQRYGKKISVTTGKRWLVNPVYRGDLEYKNGEVISNTHVPIISREEAAQVDRLLRRNRRLPPRTASAPRSLAGLLGCGECGSSMTVTRVTSYRKDREYLYLRPMNCPRNQKCKSLSYEQILEATIERICGDLPEAVSELELPDLERVKGGLTGAIASKREILAQLPELEATGIFDAETAQIRAYKLRNEIAELEGKLAQLPPVNLKATAQAVSIAQFWLDLSETERRFYFREFIRKIEIVRQGDDWDLKLMFIF